MLPNAQPKPRPKLLSKRDAAADLAKVDRAERAKVKARSGDRCEVRVYDYYCYERTGRFTERCLRRATEIHHLIGGIGRRNKGRSILAEHRLHVCADCHREITNHVLKVYDGTQAECAATVRYERIR